MSLNVQMIKNQIYLLNCTKALTVHSSHRQMWWGIYQIPAGRTVSNDLVTPCFFLLFFPTALTMACLQAHHSSQFHFISSWLVTFLKIIDPPSHNPIFFLLILFSCSLVLVFSYSLFFPPEISTSIPSYIVQIFYITLIWIL